MNCRSLLGKVVIVVAGAATGCEALIDADFDQPLKAPERADVAEDSGQAEIRSGDADSDASRETSPRDASFETNDGDISLDGRASTQDAVDGRPDQADGFADVDSRDALGNDAIGEGGPTVGADGGADATWMDSDGRADREEGGPADAADADANDGSPADADADAGAAADADDVVDASGDLTSHDGDASARCEGGTARCVGNRLQTCDTNGQWSTPTSCPTATPVCAVGACSAPPSCVPSLECGPSMGRTSCCATADVPGGAFTRRYETNNYPATVSAFRLDRFEVTVGRFRRFLSEYDAFRPLQGQGAHPRIENSGWHVVWNADLPATAANVRSNLLSCSSNATWTDNAASNEEKPIDCVTWFEALLFCIWDGGRLPTDAEWSYAASAQDNRLYPWGGTSIDHTRAVYGCGTSDTGGDCYDSAFIGVVGSKSPLGDGAFGQSDLAGNVYEWVLDGDGDRWFYEFPMPCVDCARLATLYRRARGGAWYVGIGSLQIPSTYASNLPSYRNDVGFRCARDP